MKKSISIFSRPEDYKVLPEDFDDRNIISVLSRYVDITNVEISKNDESQIDKLCQTKGIKNNKVFLPRVMQSVYDTDKSRLKEIYEKGAIAAEGIMKLDSSIISLLGRKFKKIKANSEISLLTNTRLMPHFALHKYVKTITPYNG